jgi:predicted PurR-regulated permease PerM
MDGDRGPFLSNPFVARAARWGLLAWSVIGLLILAWVVYRYILYPIRIVFAPLVVALIVIYLLNPLVTRMQRRGIPRLWGTLLCYVVFLSIVGVALAYLIPAVTDQVKAFVSGVPDLLTRAQTGLEQFAARLGVSLDPKAFLQSFQPGKGSAFHFLVRLTSFTSGVVHVAFSVILGMLLAFYLLVDLPKVQRGADALVPVSRREEIRGVTGQVGRTIGAFFRGQLLVALIVGLASMIAFNVVGLPYFALLGALTGLFALVPLIGTVIAAVPVLFVAATSNSDTGGLLHVPGGWRLVLACGLVLVLLQQLDVRVLSPRLLSRSVRLHPVTVVLSLLVGGTLLGLWGMLLAVPTVAAMRVVVLHLWDTRSSWPPKASSAELRAAAEDDDESPPAKVTRLVP